MANTWCTTFTCQGLALASSFRALDYCQRAFERARTRREFSWLDSSDIVYEIDNNR